MATTPDNVIRCYKKFRIIMKIEIDKLREELQDQEINLIKQGQNHLLQICVISGAITAFNAYIYQEISQFFSIHLLN